MRRSLLVGLVGVPILVLGACRPGTPDLDFGERGTVVLPDLAGSSLFPTLDGGVLVGDAGPLVRLGVDGSRGADLEIDRPPGCDQLSVLQRDGDGFVGVCQRPDGDAGVARTAADGTVDLNFGHGGVAALPAEMAHVSGVVALPAGGYAVAGTGPQPGTRESAPPVVLAVLDEGGTVAFVESATPGVSPIPPEIDATPFTSGAGVQSTDSGAAFLASVGTTIVSVPFHTAAVTRLAADGRPIGDLIAPGIDLRQDGWTGVVDLDAGRYAIAQTVTTFDFDFHRTSTFGTVSFRLPDGTPDPAAPGFSPQTPAGDLILPRAAVATDGGAHLWIAGSAGADAAVVARFDTATGRLDPAFGAGGVATLPMATVADMAVATDGRPRVYVSGTTSTGERVVTRVFAHVGTPSTG